ncbi:unnamed protein product [Amoebophrya sp. A25]|nr:unnamed protein product [Amoebophrya sp. A25]|eukprot:GSA25T00022108001.1
MEDLASSHGSPRNVLRRSRATFMYGIHKLVAHDTIIECLSCRAGFTRDARSCDGTCPACECLPGFKCCCAAPPGYYSLGDRALVCPGGTFQDAYGQSDCKPCPPTRKTSTGAIEVISYKPLKTRSPPRGEIVPKTVHECFHAECGVRDATALPKTCASPSEIHSAMTQSVVDSVWCGQYLGLTGASTLVAQCHFAVGKGVSFTSLGSRIGRNNLASSLLVMFLFLHLLACSSFSGVNAFSFSRRYLYV